MARSPTDPGVGTPPRAAKLSRDAIPDALNAALAHHDAGRLGEAHALYRAVLEIDPANADALHLDGLVALQGGRPDIAIALFRQAISHDADQAIFHVHLGNALRRAGDMPEAAEAYDRAVELDPTLAEARRNRATFRQDTGHHEAALEDIAVLGEAFDEAAELAATSLDALGRTDEAMAALEATIERVPGRLATRLALARLLERRSLLDQAASVVDSAKSHWPSDPRLLRLEAMLLRRLGRPDEARATLAGLDVDRLPPQLARGIHAELARIADRLQDADSAVHHVTEQNRLAGLQLAASPLDKRTYLDQVRRNTETFDAALVSGWPDTASEDKGSAPVFLVGFPRSGTTLLDQVLDAHPAIQVIEEKPVLLPVRDAVAARPGGYPAALAKLGAADIADLRALYASELARAGADPSKLVVNKLPLNLIHAGLIHRLFPDARFLLALRHPCDTVLSAWMQDFELTNAMANFLTLEDSAALYDAVMGLWLKYRRLMPLRVHEIRYEEIVSDLEGSARAALAFLGLDWDPSILNYHEHARTARRIRTPSYEQVTERLYDRAVQRWRRYERILEPVRPVLQPYVEECGYN